MNETQLPKVEDLVKENTSLRAACEEVNRKLQEGESRLRRLNEENEHNFKELQRELELAS